MQGFGLGQASSGSFLPSGMMNRNRRIETEQGVFALKELVDVPVPQARRSPDVLRALACFWDPCVAEIAVGTIIVAWIVAAVIATPANSPYWKGLRPYKEKTKTNSQSGKSIRYYVWDYTHRDVEVYDSKGNRMGSADPVTG